MRNFNLIDKAFLLKKTPFFGALDLDLLLSIADKMETLSFRPSDSIFKPNQEAYRIYLIVTGNIAIADTQGTPLAELSTGDFFGDEAMFSDKRRAYSACCKTKVELLALSRSHLLTIIHECPSVALALLESYTLHLNFRAR